MIYTDFATFILIELNVVYRLFEGFVRFSFCTGDLESQMIQICIICYSAECLLDLEVTKNICVVIDDCCASNDVFHDFDDGSIVSTSYIKRITSNVCRIFINSIAVIFVPELFNSVLTNRQLGPFDGFSTCNAEVNIIFLVKDMSFLVIILIVSIFYCNQERFLFSIFRKADRDLRHFQTT